MPDASQLVLALTAREIDEFLPEPLPAEIRLLFPRVEHWDVAGLGPGEWDARLRQAGPEVLVTCWRTPPLPEILPAQLRYVCHLAGSVRRLVSRRQLEAGLVVTNWGGSVARTVAEGTLTLILAALRRTGVWALRMHRDRGWAEAGDVVQSLFGRRVGVHGFGFSARELTRLLEPFGNPVTVFAPDVADAVLARHGARRAATLDALFAGNEVIVELASLNDATRGCVTERQLRLIPDGGVFVNVARGAIVEEADLIRVAREGWLQIALDVFAREPLPADSLLRGLANVTLSPHVSGPPPERRRDAGALALRNLRAYREGRPLEAQITPAIHDAAS